MYTCRECERPINQATEICPYCGADLTTPPEASGEPETEPAKKPNLAKALLRWAVLIALIWAFLWFVLPEKRGDPVLRAEQAALEALRDARAALADYAEARGGSYPASLEAVADRVRPAAQKAQAENYQLEYFPGPPDPSGDAAGQIRTYSLLARPGRFGYRSFFVDETGVIRATSENRPATAKDPPI